MSFDPGTFLDVAKSLLSGASNEAEFRTVSGRAYYSVYGVMRARLCRAKGVSSDRLFGRAGRHGDVVSAIWKSSGGFRHVGVQYQRLLAKRVQSDYKLDSEVLRADAEIALQDANWVVSHLVKLKDKDFKSFPLFPKQ